MPDLTTQFLILGIYFVLFVAGVLAVWIWQIKQRNERPPVEFKLLRGPGESLRKRIASFNEDILYWFMAAALAPLVAAYATLKLLSWVTPHMRLTYGLGIIAIPMLVVLFFAGRSSLKRLSRFRNDRLGYLGERAVGESLEPLLFEGYRIFHDVPASVSSGSFNVDHVAVGPNGVFAIETKARRKGRARPGFEAHKVAYDGRQLIWPWAEDTYGLKQAEDRARWLREWINKMTGLGIAVQPVLVLPGWYVVPKGNGPVAVVSHKMLFSAITRNPTRVLFPDQIDLIARQLDVLCRDIED